MEAMNKKKIYLIISVLIITTLVFSMFFIIFRHRNIEKGKIVQEEEKIAQKTISAEKNSFNDSGNTQSVTINTDGGLLKYIDFTTSQELEREKVTRNYNDNSTIIIQTKYNTTDLAYGNIYIKSNLDNSTGYQKPVNENNSNYIFKQISVYKDGIFKEKLTPQVDNNNPWNYIWIYTVDKSKYGDSVELRVDWKTEYYALTIRTNGGLTGDSTNATWHSQNSYTRTVSYGQNYKFASTNYHGDANGCICLASTVDPLGDQSRRAIPYREGYTFKGWKITDESGNDISKYNVKVTAEDDAELMPACGGTTYYINNGTYCGTIVVSEEWGANTYLVTINVDGGYLQGYENNNKVEKQSFTRAVKYGEEKILLSTYGCLLDNNGYVWIDNTSNYGGEKDSTGHYIPYREGYKFKTIGVYVNGQRVNEMSYPISDNDHDGGHWYWNYVQSYASDVELRVEWELNSYTLTIKTNGGEAQDITSNVFHYQEAYTRKVTYGQDYKFASTNYIGNENGNICIASTVDPLGDFSKRAVPYRPGYTFKGWSITDESGNDISSYNASVTSVEDPAYMPACGGTTYYINNGTYKGDIIVTAEWEANQYTLTIKPNGCLTADSENAYLHSQESYSRIYKYGENFCFASTNTRGSKENEHICLNRKGGEDQNHRAVPYREGYIFNGWIITDMSGNDLSSYGATVTGVDDEYIRFGTTYYINNGTYEGDMIVQAQWTKVTKVTMNKNGGMGGTSNFWYIKRITNNV